MNNLTPTQSQFADQSLKGAVLGALAWAGVKWNMPAEVLFVLTTAASFGLAYLSTLVGDKNLAQFVAAPAKEEKPAPKAAAKKAPAKKASK